MEDQYPVLDSDIGGKSIGGEAEQIISVNKFILLSVVSFGLYEVWWSYKAWRYYKEKESLDIMPAARAIFAIFYLYSLMEKIQGEAREKGYAKTYSSGWLFTGFIVANLISRAPEPFWIISFLSITCLIAPFKALNYVKQNSEGTTAVEQNSFNGKQIALLIIGLLLWVAVIYGLAIQQ
jgi:hypothetical protein